MFDRAILEQRYREAKASLPDHVQLIAVSKRRTVEEIQALYDLGHRAFGENYPQELRDKQRLLPKDIQWHFIGHLQSNKVKYLAPFVHLVHTIDSESVLNELQKQALRNHRTIDVLIQLHIAKEKTKHGASLDVLIDLLERSSEWPNIIYRGLMGMATNTCDEEVVNSEFERVQRVQQDVIRNGLVKAKIFDQLSMGMTGDAILAIKNGSTMVRIGTAIFGDRD